MDFSLPSATFRTEFAGPEPEQPVSAFKEAAEHVRKTTGVEAAVEICAESTPGKRPALNFLKNLALCTGLRTRSSFSATIRSKWWQGAILARQS